MNLIHGVGNFTGNIISDGGEIYTTGADDGVEGNLLHFRSTATSANTACWGTQTGPSGTGTTVLVRCSSSERFKDNIRDYFVDKEKLFQLQPRMYEMNDFTLNSGEIKVGLIAEEVEKIFPELIIYEEINGTKVPLSLDHKVISSLLIPIIKEQDQRIKDLEYEINLMKQSLCKLGAVEWC